MPVCCGGELAVDGRKDDACRVPLCFQLSPDVCSAGVEAEDAPFHTVTKRLQPCAELSFSPATRQTLYASADFSDTDGADVEF